MNLEFAVQLLSVVSNSVYILIPIMKVWLDVNVIYIINRSVCECDFQKVSIVIMFQKRTLSHIIVT